MSRRAASSGTGQAAGAATETTPTPGFRRSDFSFLWGAESVSMFGTQVTLIALPLTAVQLLNASEFQMGILTAVGWLPMVMLGLFVGVWVDRGRLVPIMLTANIARMLLIALIPLAHALGVLSMMWLLTVAFVAGVFTAFFDVAYQTHVVNVVAPERLSTANSRLEFSRSLAQMMGPALGGALVAALSPPPALGLDALSYGLAALLLLPLLRSRPGAAPRPDPSSSASRPSAPTLRLIREGISFIWQNTLIRAVVVAASASNFFIAGVMALQFLLAVNVLDMSATQLGFALAAEGTAALLAAMATPRLNAWLGEGRLVLISLVLMTTGVVLMFTAANQVQAGLGLYVAAQVAFGVSGPLINISLVTLRQRLTPRELLGRVNASARVAIMASLPLGAVIFGLVATLIGLTGAFGIIAVGLAVVALAARGPMSRVPPARG